MQDLRSSLLVVAAVVVATRPAVAEDAPVPRVGIVIGVALDVDPAVADALGEALANALSGKLEVDAIGGTDVARRLPPKGLSDECVATPACIADLGARLGADQLLFLAVVGADEAGFQIDATFVEIASGRQAARPRVSVASRAAAPEVFAAAAQRYLPDATVRSSGDRTLILQGPAMRHRPIRSPVWALGGTGLGFVVTGAVFGLSAKSKYDGCNDSADACTDTEKSSIRSRARLADAGFGIGIACAVAAVVIYARTPLERLPISPVVSPIEGGAVVALDGRF